MEYIVPDVPYIGQPDEATCWNAAYKMMLKYKGKNVTTADSLPNDKMMRERGILDGEFLACRSALGLCSSTYKGFQTVEDIASKLKSYGPIWVSGRYCDGKYKHIVVLRGIKDPLFGDAEVYLNDPWSAFRYGLAKPRWLSLKSFTSKMNDAAYSCQHWL
jgi:hypothetical protein